MPDRDMSMIVAIRLTPPGDPSAVNWTAPFDGMRGSVRRSFCSILPTLSCLHRKRNGTDVPGFPVRLSSLARPPRWYYDENASTSSVRLWRRLAMWKRPSVWKGLAAGMAAGLVASWAMNRFQAAVSPKRKRREEEEDATVEAAERRPEAVFH